MALLGQTTWQNRIIKVESVSNADAKLSTEVNALFFVTALGILYRQNDLIGGRTKSGDKSLGIYLRICRSELPWV